jgi:hypothetical protein
LRVFECRGLGCFHVGSREKSASPLPREKHEPTHV